jgi:hypothetical protein
MRTPRSHSSSIRSDDTEMPRDPTTISCIRIKGTCAQTALPFLTTTRSLFLPMNRPNPATSSCVPFSVESKVALPSSGRMISSIGGSGSSSCSGTVSYAPVIQLYCEVGGLRGGSPGGNANARFVLITFHSS